MFESVQFREMSENVHMYVLNFISDNVNTYNYKITIFSFPQTLNIFENLIITIRLYKYCIFLFIIDIICLAYDVILYLLNISYWL